MKRVHVAVGVICRNHKILLSRRHADSHQGGLWEFPGGKVEADESVQHALVRELEEELGIQISNCEPLLKIQHGYVDKEVLLDVWWIDRYNGEESGREGQPLQWAEASTLLDLDFPDANEAIVQAVVARLASAR